MSRARHIGLVLAAAGVLALAAPAAAQSPSVVMQVPVTLEKVHSDISGFEVQCDVFSAANRRIGSGSESGEIDGARGFEGTLSVSVELDDADQNASAVRYQCDLLLQHAGRTASPGDGGDTPIPLRARPGTQFVGSVEGDL